MLHGETKLRDFYEIELKLSIVFFIGFLMVLDQIGTNLRMIQKTY